MIPKKGSENLAAVWKVGISWRSSPYEWLHMVDFCFQKCPVFSYWQSLSVLT